MNILLKNVLIADVTSPHNGLVKDILIVDGLITKIDNTITNDTATIIEQKDAVVTTGWVDCFANFNDPGFEFKETLETGAEAALAGGYTQVFVVPNTNPTINSKSQVEYIVQKSKQLPIAISPLGAVTKNVEGKDLAEMYDMQASGAIAFSDGMQPVQTAGLLLKALQYVKAFNGIIIQMPVDESIGSHGLINEGIISTQLGLPGIPAIAEELIIKRDIDLLRYTQSKLHITGISTATSVALIAAAKAEGLQISCSVTPYHLCLCDEDVQGYDTNLKLNPPLRTKVDMLALQAAVLNGTIDCIASHHLPQDWDNKVCEFEYAKAGMIGLQTAFAVVNDSLPQLTIEQLSTILSSNARNIFNLPATNIAEGACAELTLFSKTGITTFTKANNKSKAANSPFFDKELKGKILAVINKGKLFINEN